VIEDDFASGRPDIAAVGAILTGDVLPWELYKLRLLNAGHSAIAHLSALAGIDYVDEALAVPELRGFLQALLLDESAPTLEAIPGHPPQQYVETVLDRFANTGIRDQISRLCVDGTAKAATFMMPILVDQLERGGPIDHTTHALAAWAHYLATVPVAEQAADTEADELRPLARAALDTPSAFIHERAGFPPGAASDTRLATVFTHAHQSIAEYGSLGALRRLRP
jgi:mannitol 2-dehydrogenase